MTTKVTIDAHAGWPVKVIQVQLGADGAPSAVVEVTVAPHTTQEFYVHQHLELHVSEMPCPAPAA